MRRAPPWVRCTKTLALKIFKVFTDCDLRNVQIARQLAHEHAPLALDQGEDVLPPLVDEEQALFRGAAILCSRCHGFVCFPSEGYTRGCESAILAERRQTARIIFGNGLQRQVRVRATSQELDLTRLPPAFRRAADGRPWETGEVLDCNIISDCNDILRFITMRDRHGSSHHSLMGSEGDGRVDPLKGLLKLSATEKAERGLEHTPAEIAQQPGTGSQPSIVSTIGKRSCRIFCRTPDYAAPRRNVPWFF